MGIVTAVVNWILSNIGTLGMFILTLFYVGYTKKMMESSNETVKQGEMTLKESKKPEVIAYFDIENLFNLNFIIENIGKTAAINVKFQLEVISGKDIAKIRGFNALSEGISTLAPAQKLKTFADIFGSTCDEKGRYPVFQITIEYEDKDKNLYKDSYTLDTNMFSGASRIKEGNLNDVVKELEKIAKKMK